MVEIEEVKKEEQAEITPVGEVSEEPSRPEEPEDQPGSEEERLDLPDWLKPIGNDQYELTTRRRKYILEDVEYNKIMQAKARTTGGKTSGQALDQFEMALIAISMVNPKLTEMELRKVRGSEFMRLRAAIYKLYDIESFLSE